MKNLVTDRDPSRKGSATVRIRETMQRRGNFVEVESVIRTTVATAAIVGIGAVCFETPSSPSIVPGAAAKWLPRYLASTRRAFDPRAKAVVRGASTAMAVVDLLKDAS